MLRLLGTGLSSPQQAPGCPPATGARVPVPRRARITPTCGPSKDVGHSYDAAGEAESWSPGNTGLAQPSFQLSTSNEAAVTTAAAMATQKST
jgi:hypothetical protein